MAVYKDEKTGKWYCKFYYHDHTGKRKQKMKRGFALQRDAKKWESDFLAKMGRKLYYFHKDSGLEIDFLMRYKSECVLVECKARSGNAKSTRTILKHPEKYHVNHAIKIGDYNVGREGALLTLPFYMAFLLTELQ